MFQKLALAAGALAGVVLASAGFLTALAAKEHDNRFCISCHLHEARFTRFGASPPADLAAYHHARKGIGCIDCHGGADLAMRLEVWAVAGVDTLRFLVGRYREPDHMRLPLRPKECRRCHTPILAAGGHGGEEGGGRAESYHAIRDHDSVGISCVRCHSSHTIGSSARLEFISRARVQPICRECHPTFGTN